MLAVNETFDVGLVETCSKLDKFSNNRTGEWRSVKYLGNLKVSKSIIKCTEWVAVL